MLLECFLVMHGLEYSRDLSLIGVSAIKRESEDTIRVRVAWAVGRTWDVTSVDMPKGAWA